MDELIGTIEDAAATVVGNALRGIETPLVIAVIALGATGRHEVLLQQSVTYQSWMPEAVQAMFDDVVTEALTQLTARIMEYEPRENA